MEPYDSPAVLFHKLFNTFVENRRRPETSYAIKKQRAGIFDATTAPMVQYLTHGNYKSWLLMQAVPEIILRDLFF
jgi:hypothetical protein